jgi:hypothetical protein
VTLLSTVVFRTKKQTARSLGVFEVNLNAKCFIKKKNARFPLYLFDALWLFAGRDAAPAIRLGEVLSR